MWLWPGKGNAYVDHLRGGSKRPLYLTAAGIDVKQAAALVKSMHGGHRVPALLKRADQLSRIGNVEI